jgi:hypothetical protein
MIVRSDILFFFFYRWSPVGDGAWIVTNNVAISLNIYKFLKKNDVP